MAADELPIRSPGTSTFAFARPPPLATDAVIYSYVAVKPYVETCPRQPRYRQE